MVFEVADELVGTIKFDASRAFAISARTSQFAYPFYSPRFLKENTHAKLASNRWTSIVFLKNIVSKRPATEILAKLRTVN